MPALIAVVFRPGRRSHRGRVRPRNRSRVHFAGRCSSSRPSSSALPVPAASRSRERRARAASARASALATSSSASTCDTAAASPALDCGSSGSVTSLGPPESSASGPSGSCTEKQLITGTWAQSWRQAAAFVALTCGNTRSPGNGAGRRWRWTGVDHRSVRLIFSNQENFLFRCGRVIGCDQSWLSLPRCSAPVWWRRRQPRPGLLSATTPPAPRASCPIRFWVRRATTPPTTPSV